ncbi:MAG: pentapeptide repeat-containing protein [Pseudobacteriovorax sp.]|nr:pentapeptide repeat-containing protein [Pseudobacteriovorax sp.]
MADINLIDKEYRIIADDSNLTSSKFSDCFLKEVQFKDSNFLSSSFEECAFKNTQFKKVDLSGVSISDCNLQGMTIEGIAITELIEAYKAKLG